MDPVPVISPQQSTMFPYMYNLFNYGTVLVSLLVGFYLYAKYKQTYWSRRGIYSPPANWFFGHFRDAFLMRASPPEVMGNLHKSCTGQADRPVIGFYILQKPFLLLRSAEVIKHVLVKDFHIFPNRHFSSRKTDVVNSTSLFAIDNPEWKYLRVKLSPAFTTGKQKKLYNLMLECADNMKRYLADKVKPQNGQDITLEVRTISSKYTTDVISSLAFGVRTNSFDEPEPEFYTRNRKIFALTIPRALQTFANFFFPRVNDFLGATFVGEHGEFYRKVFWESMNDREKLGVKRGDIIDLLVELKNEKQNSEFTFEGDRLLAQSMVFFLAGIETGAITMTFTLFELAKNPDIQRKVRSEIAKKIGKEALAYEHISEMTYLHQVVSEALRLYPTAPLIDRVAIADYKIPGTDIVIEKGTVVYTALNGLHEDPEYHPDPRKYDPDRFSEERKPDIKPCTYMPFGDGPRICIGMRTGMLQVMVGLITFFSEYEVSLNPNYKNELSKRAIFLAPAKGVHLYVKKSPIIK